MKKLAFVIIMLFYTLIVLGQRKDCHNFVLNLNINDTIFNRCLCKEYMTPNIFKDSCIFNTEKFFMKNENEEWYIMKDSVWILLFNAQKPNEYIYDVFNSNIGLKFEKTEYLCNGSPLYHVTYKPFDENCFLIDYGDHFFTPKDGFIIMSDFDSYLVREDMIPFLKEFFIGNIHIDVNSILKK